MTDQVPEFIVSPHGRQRLTERLHCKPSKMLKVTAKAFNSKSIPIPKFVKTNSRTEYYHQGKNNRVARELMGYVFIFAIDLHKPSMTYQKTLVTIL